MGPILGAMFAIIIGMLSMPSLMSWQTQAKNNINAAQVAQTARQFNEAATQYIQSNAVTLQATATATTPVSVSVAQMQAANLLPSTFNSTNTYNQTWQLQVLQPTAGNLQALALTTGGDSLSDTQSMRIARLIGSSGGFFPKNDTGLYAGGAANAYGTSWGPLSAAGYTAQAGRLASLLTFNNGQLTDNRLYRNAVPGQPQLNTMTTPLIMNSVQTANSACSTTGAIARDTGGALLACRGGFWKPASGSSYWQDPAGTFTALPTTDAVGTVRVTLDTGRAFMWTGGGWSALSVDQNGNLVVPGTLNAAGGRVIAWNQVTEGGVLQLVGANGVSMFLESNNGTFRLVNSPWNKELFSVDQNGSVVANGRLTTNEYVQINGTATEGTACSPNGLVGRDINGLILSCQSGVWSRPAGSLGRSACYWTGYGSCTVSCPTGYYVASTAMGPWAGCGSNTLSPAAMCCKG